MSHQEMQSPVREITIDAKRELPDFVIEGQRALERLRNPGVKRPVRPMYSFIKTRTPDLEPSETTPEMRTWESLRAIARGQSNYPRWVGSVAVGHDFHTGVWYSVAEQEEPSIDHYCTLRCSCRLPAFDEPDSEEYGDCAAQDSIIADRAKIYRQFLGLDGNQLEVAGGGLSEALGYVVSEVKNDHLIWPPSHRSDLLLAEGLAMTFNVGLSKIVDAARGLQKKRLLEIKDYDKPVFAILH